MRTLIVWRWSPAKSLPSCASAVSARLSFLLAGRMLSQREVTSPLRRRSASRRASSIASSLPWARARRWPALSLDSALSEYSASMPARSLIPTRASRRLSTNCGWKGHRRRIDRSEVGLGYEAMTDAAREAMLTAGQCEGLILDPVYTAKAFAGLAAAVRSGEIERGERTVFLHTGGLPGLFGHPIAAEFAATADGLGR